MYDRLPIPEGVRIQVEPRVERGEAPWPERRGDAYRKIDQLVIYDDRFRALGLKPAVVERMQALIGSENLKLFRDAALMKPAQVGSAKGMHQGLSLLADRADGVEFLLDALRARYTGKRLHDRHSRQSQARPRASRARAGRLHRKRSKLQLRGRYCRADGGG